MNDQQRFDEKQLDLQGHRGCRGLVPENTIPAFLKALELGVTTLEMDVVITKDEQVILSHEPFFNHEITTKPDGSFVSEEEEKNLNIYQMTFAETQLYDVGLKPHPRFPQQQKMAVTKPLLSVVMDTVLAWCAEHQKPIPNFNIETKCLPATDNKFHPEPARFVDLLMAVITDKRLESHTIIQSFDFRTLQYLHKLFPNVKTAALIEEDDNLPLEEHLQQLGFLPDIYSPAMELVTENLIAKCHRQNIQFIPWTVNDPVEMQRLISMGVDGIITDYPNLYKR